MEGGVGYGSRAHRPHGSQVNLARRTVEDPQEAVDELRRMVCQRRQDEGFSEVSDRERRSGCGEDGSPRVVIDVVIWPIGD